MKIHSFNQITLKIIAYDKVIITNYDRIIDFSDSFILIDGFSIHGVGLVISKIDEISVEINGKIEKVEITEI